MIVLSVNTPSKTALVDITDAVGQKVRASGVEKGICTLFVPHTTAGITINENADPSVRRDILMEMNKVIPMDDNYQHGEGNSAAHIKASLMGFSQSLFIENKKLVLGTWQGIYFCEFDGPRSRKVYIKILREE